MLDLVPMSVVPISYLKEIHKFDPSFEVVVEALVQLASSAEGIHEFYLFIYIPFPILLRFMPPHARGMCHEWEVCPMAFLRCVSVRCVPAHADRCSQSGHVPVSDTGTGAPPGEHGRLAFPWKKFYLERQVSERVRE